VSPAPALRGPRGRPLRHLRAQWVLALLLAGMLGVLLGLPLLAIAPNRLLSGRGVKLLELASGAWLLLPWLLLAGAALLRPRRTLHAACAAVAAAWLLALVAFAGAAAARQAALLPALARISLGAGFWLALWLGWAVYADALRRAAPQRWASTLAHMLLLLLLAWLLGSGALDALSLLKEYANRQDVFQAALWRHLQIVATTLAAALALGLPLGLAAARRPGLARPLFALLNGVQTVPSIALFGLLIAPLAWLGQVWPGWGLQGIGLLPAVIALTLYALLPIVHGLVAGLQQVPAAAVEAATGMGMSRRQRLWQVELPLALPVLLSALRLTSVQLVGLAVVAALIGAGGLGTIIFQGLLSSALDLVLLGVLPVVALALAIDAAFRLLAPRGQPQ
jgi:osmoprotectant transport system permease protein